MTFHPKPPARHDASKAIPAPATPSTPSRPLPKDHGKGQLPNPGKRS
ncbi:hypothetical protein FB548_2709 [Pseudoxanthomonas sp. 3HH-4]|nr:hypothetical protein FB548_2709 [Pseudoxanthomonas sp. 3HH-4]